MATRRGQTSREGENQQTEQQGAGGGTLDQDSMDNLQQQLSEAMQPAMANMREQLSQTVNNLAEQAGATMQRAGAGGDDGDSSSTAESAESMWESITQTLRNIWAWIVEMVRRFGDQVAEAIGNFVGLLVQRAIKSAF